MKMQILMILFVLLHLKCVVSTYNGFLTFKSFHKETRRFQKVKTGELGSWDAAWPTMHQMVLDGNGNVSIIFRCNFEKLFGLDILKVMIFYFKWRQGHPMVKEFTAKRSQVWFPLGVNTSIYANITSGEDGGSASLYNIPPTKSLDGLQFHCDGENRRGKRTSNTIEVLDLRKSDRSNHSIGEEEKIRASRRYPRMSRKMEKTIFVTDGNNISLTCQFENRSFVTPEIAFRGYTIDLDSKISIRADIEHINSYQSVPIHANIDPPRPKKGQSIVYTASRLVSEYVKNQSSTHYIECIGHTNGGTVRRPVIIQVVPQPIVEYRRGIPRDSKRLKCSAHTCTCRVKNKKEIEEFGAELSTTWNIGYMSDNALFRHMKKMVDRDELRLSDLFPLVSEKEKMKIYCDIEIRYPATMPIGPDRSRSIYRETISAIIPIQRHSSVPIQRHSSVPIQRHSSVPIQRVNKKTFSSYWGPILAISACVSACVLPIICKRYVWICNVFRHRPLVLYKRLKNAL